MNPISGFVQNFRQNEMSKKGIFDMESLLHIAGGLSVIVVAYFCYLFDVFRTYGK